MNKEQSGDGPDRVMVDIETLGLEPGAAIISIGACRFRPQDGVVGGVFYVEIDADSCRGAGLHVDEDTVEWWEGQDQALAPLDGETALVDALTRLSNYIGDAEEVWANSPSFDCRLLEAAYDAVGIDEPWDYQHQRDVRTIRSLPDAVELDLAGREHHALDDAIHQAREVAATIANHREPGMSSPEKHEPGGDTVSTTIGTSTIETPKRVHNPVTERTEDMAELSADGYCRQFLALLSAYNRPDVVNFASAPVATFDQDRWKIEETDGQYILVKRNAESPLGEQLLDTPNRNQIDGGQPDE